MTHPQLAGVKCIHQGKRHAVLEVPSLASETVNSIAEATAILADALLDVGLEMVWMQPPVGHWNPPRVVVRTVDSSGARAMNIAEYILG